MVETKAKRPRGRPKGSRNTKTVKPQVSALVEELAGGNGRDEAAHGPIRESLAMLDHERMEEDIQAGRTPWPEPAKVPSRPTFPNLFVHTVENGYIIRPAYPQGDRMASTDVRTWIVPTREALAALIVELMAVPRLDQETPQQLPQPGVFYSPPIIIETAAS